jgi:hypothetical protein
LWRSSTSTDSGKHERKASVQVAEKTTPEDMLLTFPTVSSIGADTRMIRGAVSDPHREDAADVLMLNPVEVSRFRFGLARVELECSLAQDLVLGLFWDGVWALSRNCARSGGEMPKLQTCFFGQR